MEESPFRTASELEARKLVHAAIGRFVVAFELVIAELRAACRLMLERGGLGLKNQPLANIALSRLSASQLSDLVGAMYCEFKPDDRDGANELAGVLKAIDKLRAKRNRIIHATWTIGVPDGHSGGDAVAWSLVFDRARRSGQTVEEMALRSSDFDQLTSEATRLQVLGIRLCYCINQSEFSLAEELRRST